LSYTRGTRHCKASVGLVGLVSVTRCPDDLVNGRNQTVCPLQASTPNLRLQLPRSCATAPPELLPTVLQCQLARVVLDSGEQGSPSVVPQGATAKAIRT